MKKIIIVDEQAEKELASFSVEVRIEFGGLMDVLGVEGLIGFPDARKISKDLYEMRVRENGIYRGFYAYLKGPYIVVLHLFQKKSQKTPKRYIETAIKRLKFYQ